MGMITLDTYLSDKETKDEVLMEFNVMVEEQRQEHGNHGFTGTWADAPGLEFPKGLQKMGKDDAFEYLSQHAERWENAMAIFLVGGGCLIGSYFQ